MSIVWNELGDGVYGDHAIDLFGLTVGISDSGTTIVVGAPLADEESVALNTKEGLTRVYDWNGTDWIQRGDDIYGGPGIDESGYFVDISADGSTIASGAWYNSNVNGIASGAVRVYEWCGGQWVQKGDTLTGERAHDRSGNSLKLSSDGNTIIYGMFLNDGDDSTNTDRGSARVYEWDGTMWIQKGQDLDGEDPGDRFGHSVGISGEGDIVVIGSNFNAGNGTRSGHVRAFQWNGTVWVQMGNDLDGEFEFDEFGYTVSLSYDGNILAVGARLHDADDGFNSFRGTTYVYEWNGTNWIQMGTKIDGEAIYDESGFLVSLSNDGTIVAIGDHYNDDTGGNAGQVRVFRWNGTDWVQYGNDLNGDSAVDLFGHTVALSGDGNVLITGAFLNDTVALEAGQARMYAINDPIITEIIDYCPPTTVPPTTAPPPTTIPPTTTKRNEVYIYYSPIMNSIRRNRGYADLVLYEEDSKAMCTCDSDISYGIDITESSRNIEKLRNHRSISRLANMSVNGNTIISNDRSNNVITKSNRRKRYSRYDRRKFKI